MKLMNEGVGSKKRKMKPGKKKKKQMAPPPLFKGKAIVGKAKHLIPRRGKTDGESFLILVLFYKPSIPKAGIKKQTNKRR